MRRLASLRLTIVLLAALAAVAALGTFVPQGLTPQDYQRQFPGAASWIRALGLDHFYQGPVYRGLLAALVANLLACGLGRSAEGWRNFRGRGKPALFVPLAAREEGMARLAAAGFRVVSAEPLIARRRAWAFLGFPLVHLAPVAILAGGLWGSLSGFVGTRNLPVGTATSAVDEGSSDGERVLPFELFLEDFRLRYYPVVVRLKALLPDGAETTLVSREGETSALPDTPWRVKVHTFDPATGDLVYSVGDGSSAWLGPYSRGKEEGAPLRVRPTGFKDPEVRRAEATVALRGADGAPLARQVVAVNEPLVHRGTRIYLTAWGRDGEGHPFAGFQVSRDPGQPLLWGGTLALSFGLFLLLFGDGAWVREEEGRLAVRGSRATKAFKSVLAGGGADQEEGSSLQQ